VKKNSALILRSARLRARLEGWRVARPCPWPSCVLREPQDGRPRERAPQDEGSISSPHTRRWATRRDSLILLDGAERARRLLLQAHPVLRRPHFNVAKYATRSSRSFSAIPWNTPMAVPGTMVEGNIIQPPMASSVHSQLARVLNALV
jgi:hypothetical protein